MKKILVVSTSPIKKDGISKIIFEIIQYSAKTFSFEIAAPENTEQTFFEIDDIKTYTLPKKKNLFKYMMSIKELVKNNTYDIVYIHGNSAMMIFEAISTKLFCDSKIVTHCHSSSSEHKLVHHIIKPLFNVMIDKKIGCSKLASKWAYMGKNVITIPNGVEIEKYAFNEKSREEVRKGLKVGKNEILIGNVGRFTKQKNQLFLIDVFKEYLKINSNSKLILIGDGEQKSDLLDKIESLNLCDKTIVLEPTNDIERYYSAMDIMVMPSLWEGFGLVAVEAQANGLPTIVSDVFTDEVFVSNLIIKCSLKNSHKQWCNYIDGCYTSISRDASITQRLKEKEISFACMMKRINEVLRVT